MLTLELEAPGCKDSWTGTHRWAWRRERVGRTLTVVEVVGEDPVAVGEAVAWTQWWWRQRGVEAVAWTQQLWRWHDIEVHEEEEQAHSVNPSAVVEAISDLPVWTRWWSWWRSTRTQWLWRREGSWGVGGHTGGGEMKKNSSARV
jgi:hypothetical protein